MTTNTPTTLYDYALSGNNSIVDPSQLLKYQLRQWKELHRDLSAQNDAEFNHQRFNDILLCQAKIEELEVDILQFYPHLE